MLSSTNALDVRPLTRLFRARNRLRGIYGLAPTEDVADEDVAAGDAATGDVR